MNHLDVQSGLLAYHLRGMKGLLEKRSDRTYRLTTSGQRAFDILEGNASPRPDRIVSKPFSLRPFLIFLVACSLMANIFLAGSIWETRNMNGVPAEGIRAKTELLVDDSLSIIYSIYEERDTPRERLVELLIDLVEIRSNLQGLGSLSPSDGHEDFSPKLDSIIGEITEILKHDNGDTCFAVETRQRGARAPTCATV
jgi:hypothetical protein